MKNSGISILALTWIREIRPKMSLSYGDLMIGPVPTEIHGFLSMLSL